MIVPIVEGQSEEASISSLVRRVLHELGDYQSQVARPLRVKRQRVVRPGELERSLELAIRTRPGAQSCLLVLDADDDCPAELGAELRTRGRATSAVRVEVTIPKVETEAWILAGIESLRGFRGIRDDAVRPYDPEAVRDAKGAITRLMMPGRTYLPTDDMPALLARLDLRLVAQYSPSFLKFRRDVYSVSTTH